jgi:hypothetical protein
LSRQRSSKRSTILVLLWFSQPDCDRVPGQLVERRAPSLRVRLRTPSGVRGSPLPSKGRCSRGWKQIAWVSIKPRAVPTNRLLRQYFHKGTDFSTYDSNTPNCCPRSQYTPKEDPCLEHSIIPPRKAYILGHLDLVLRPSLESALAQQIDSRFTRRPLDKGRLFRDDTDRQFTTARQ